VTLLKLMVAFHLLLLPCALLMWSSDMSHPERWNEWWHNPSIAIPYCLALEVVIWGMVFFHCRREKRYARGILRLRVANLLLAQRKQKEAEEAYEEGLRLTGQKQRGRRSIRPSV